MMRVEPSAKLAELRAQLRPFVTNQLEPIAREIDATGKKSTASRFAQFLSADVHRNST